jgi:hypothetical protein
MALYLFTTSGGRPAFYVEHGTGYDLVGRPCFRIVETTVYDATGAAIYRITDEHFTPCENAAWPALYFNPTDLEPAHLPDTDLRVAFAQNSAQH